MAAKGPKSNDEIEHDELFGTEEIDAAGRPPAPLCLTQAEQEIWNRVVASMPPGWFRPETWDLLEDYCRHEVAAKRLAPIVNAALAAVELATDLLGSTNAPSLVDAVENLRKITAIRNQETRAASSLATRLRISLQATRTADQSRGTPDAGEPDPEDFE